MGGWGEGDGVLDLLAVGVGGPALGIRIPRMTMKLATCKYI